MKEGAKKRTSPYAIGGFLLVLISSVAFITFYFYTENYHNKIGSVHVYKIAYAVFYLLMGLYICAFILCSVALRKIRKDSSLGGKSLASWGITIEIPMVIIAIALTTLMDIRPACC